MEVTLYSQTGCGNCLRLEKILSEHGVKVNKNTDIEVMRSKGFSKIPMLEISNGDNYLTLDYKSSLKWIKEEFNEG